MAFRQVMAASLTLMLAVGASPALLAQQQGTIVGQATDEADDPFTDYTVQLRHPGTLQILATQALNAEGEFSFTGLSLDTEYLVELIDTSDDNSLVCAEGPFEFENNQDQPIQSIDVNIDCGAPPAALWVLAGAAGIVASVATTVGTASNPNPPQN